MNAILENEVWEVKPAIAPEFQDIIRVLLRPSFPTEKGPLVNPTKPTHMLVGVSLPELGPLYAEILSLNPRIKEAFILLSKSGMDDLGIHSETLVWKNFPVYTYAGGFWDCAKNY